ncbi:hypothetical protein EVAR_6612_1 [Eumeta japonica]|uniref:Uncharacterized protein n=1 Tax=Eumeta variegata TaxID=151549 RepID=A0A4C1TMR3_EUMVA|nr:hypothetical protein EVAR_6612_1 [Eumeta japonica]
MTPDPRGVVGRRCAAALVHPGRAAGDLRLMKQMPRSTLIPQQVVHYCKKYAFTQRVRGAPAGVNAPPRLPPRDRLANRSRGGCDSCRAYTRTNGSARGDSFVSLYHEPHSTDVFSRRRRRTTLTQIVSQISGTTFELVKPVINSGTRWSFIMENSGAKFLVTKVRDLNRASAEIERSDYADATSPRAEQSNHHYVTIMNTGRSLRLLAAGVASREIEAGVKCHVGGSRPRRRDGRRARCDTASPSPWPISSGNCPRGVPFVRAMAAACG